MRWFKLLGVLTLWALSFVLNEVALRDLGPAAVVAGRWLVTASVLLAWLATTRRSQLVQLQAGLRLDWRRFLLLSLVGVTLLYGLQVLGQTRTSAVNAGLLANLVPVFTVLLAAVFLGERLRPAGWLGVGLALLGAWLVSAAPQIAPAADGVGGLAAAAPAGSALGDLLVAGSAFFAALYFVVGKGLLARYSPLVVTAGAATLGAATLLPIALIEGSWRGMTWPALATVIVLGLGPGLLANLWWWETAEWLDASRAALYIYLIPLITMLFAVLFLDEQVGPAQLAGAVLVLAGVWLAEQARRHG